MHLDALRNDIFSFREMTGAIDKLPPVPRQATSLGLFRDKPVGSDLITIDMRGGVVRVLPEVERGGPATPVVTPRAKSIGFQIKAHKQNASVHADAILRARAFGEEQLKKTFVEKRDENLLVFNLNHEVTKEYRTVGALRGKIFDSDGTTLLLDLFDDFEIAPPAEIDFELDTAVDGRLLEICTQAVRAILAPFGNGASGRVRSFCSPGFWDKLIKNPEVREAYKRWNDGEFLRSGKAFGAFPFAGIDWEEYRNGTVGGLTLIPDDKCALFPTDVGPDAYIQHWAPGTSFEEVANPGRPIYIKAAADKWDEMIEMQAKSFGLPISTYPESLRTGHA